MGQHKPTYVRLVDVVGPDIQVRCACGNLSPRCLTKQVAEDHHQQHLKNVDRARASMRQRDPSPTDQYAYYVKMAEDPQTSEADRVLWEQLARELAPRLPSNEGGEQLSLDL